MKNDYRNRRGKVGAYKGADVYIIERADYNPNGRGVIDVIADDGMKMVLNNKVIGILSSTGNVTDVKPYTYLSIYSAQEEKKEPEKVQIEGAEIELSTTIPEGYFSQFSNTVDEFFKMAGG